MKDYIMTSGITIKIICTFVYANVTIYNCMFVYAIVNITRIFKI